MTTDFTYLDTDDNFCGGGAQTFCFAPQANTDLRNAVRCVCQCSSVAFAEQVHSDIVVVVDHENVNNLGRADALVTTERGIAICIRTADCIPLLLFDPTTQIAAAIHSGWRGTAQRITTNAVECMKSLGAKPHNIFARFGPHIQAVSYTVGTDVVEAIGNRFAYTDSNGLLHACLQVAVVEQLMSSGLKKENIETCATDTFASDNLPSYRRTHTSLRMITGIVIR